MRRVAVVVPARDEEATVARTLRGVCASLDEAQRRGLLDAAVVEVVAHRCVDATEARARAALCGRPQARVVRDDTSTTVGQVRDAATRRALAARAPLTPTDLRETWLLSTDADTDVGRAWVSEILAEARQSRAAAVVGLAPLDDWQGGETGRTAYDLVLAAKMRSEDRRSLHQHDHVYGANLAVRADAYLAVGGFSHVRHGEDQALVDALTASGFPVLRTRSISVTTSGRMRGRAAGGLADHLARLDAVSRATADGEAS